MGVYKKDNRWYIDYYQPDGRRKREVVTIPGVNPQHINKQDALKALSIRKAEMAQGKFDIAKPKRKIRFEELVKEYLKWAKDHHRVPQRDLAASKPLLSYFRGRYITKINLWLVDGYISKRKDEGKKPETINKELAILRRMFNLAVEWNLLSINPIQGINKKLVKGYQFKPRVLKDWEFQSLYNAASKHFKPILLCAYMTGMRRAEIGKLKWQDIDFEGGYIHLIETKNNENRSIPISEALFSTLKELKENTTSEFVFTNDSHRSYTYDSVWRTSWYKALKRSGIERRRFHDIRHTFVSNLIVREKEDFSTVMALSGRKDIRMLQRYSHTREEAKKMAISKLEKGLNLEGMDTYLDTQDAHSSIKSIG